MVLETEEIGRLPNVGDFASILTIDVSTPNCQAEIVAKNQRMELGFSGQATMA